MVMNLQDLPAAGRTWLYHVTSDVLEDTSSGDVDALVGVCGDTFWQGSLAKEYGVYTLRGEWKTRLKRQCDRCMCEFEWDVQSECSRQYVIDTLPDMDEEDVADVDVVPSPGVMNLVDILREEIWLAWKPSVNCRASCKGLCQGCGVNLNHDECQCTSGGEDNPFAALAKMKFDT